MKRQLLAKKLCFSNQPKWLFFLCCFCLFIYACHKEDVRVYAITSEHFREMALSEQQFQQDLAFEFSKINTDPIYIELGKKRAHRSKEYISEVNALLGNEVNPTYSISAENQEKLNDLRKLTGDAFRSALIKMAMESDQQLIGIHVQAISSEGAKDISLREWAAKKLPMLRENLAAVQLLK